MYKLCVLKICGKYVYNGHSMLNLLTFLLFVIFFENEMIFKKKYYLLLFDCKYVSIIHVWLLYYRARINTIFFCMNELFRDHKLIYDLIVMSCCSYVSDYRMNSNCNIVI
ncbi:hypothetical protein KUTeg_019633 [Tegillarca granosa]|uniref:Uncharacterized protein n=1 Tax=Tegillarca granosa TaxID=220873 RepID=A0ABQ9EI64_TEGGR|nr:hypothetical protein KUTeg_019633 [Tegillarca granosa]